MVNLSGQSSPFIIMLMLIEVSKYITTMPPNTLKVVNPIVFNKIPGHFYLLASQSQGTFYISTNLQGWI